MNSFSYQECDIVVTQRTLTDTLQMCYKSNKISNHTEGEDLYGSLIIHKHQKKYAFIYRQVKYDMNRNISREKTDVK